MKALIAYATRYGATASSSEEIAKVLREEGIDVKVVDTKEEKITSISEYDLIIVGSGMQMGKWTNEAENFLAKFHKEFADKKLALFVSTMKSVSEREGKTEDVANMRKVSLEYKVSKYNLQPIALGFFGGVLDFNKMNFIMRRTMSFLKPQLEKDGFQEVQPGVYELRDWNEIRKWARELVTKAIQA
ncbi:MAG: menaquinone-dependent protoporphyrinogen oxidase [Thermoproteota archaeon]|nr:menaquinone-dependent protoporphyrinogen oxidase [Thermoproteota archaeon]